MLSSQKSCWVGDLLKRSRVARLGLLNSVTAVERLRQAFGKLLVGSQIQVRSGSRSHRLTPGPRKECSEERLKAAQADARTEKTYLVSRVGRVSTGESDKKCVCIFLGWAECVVRESRPEL